MLMVLTCKLFCPVSRNICLVECMAMLNKRQMEYDGQNKEIL